MPYTLRSMSILDWLEGLAIIGGEADHPIKYGQLGVSELRKMRMLEEENARLKRLVADLTLDRHILQEVLRKKSEADPPPRTGSLDPGALRGECDAGVSAGDVAALDLVSKEPCAGTDAVADADPGIGHDKAPVRVLAYPRSAASRRLGDQPQASAPSVSVGRPAGADAGAPTQAPKLASRRGAAADSGESALEHG